MNCTPASYDTITTESCVAAEPRSHTSDHVQCSAADNNSAPKPTNYKSTSNTGSLTDQPSTTKEDRATV